MLDGRSGSSTFLISLYIRDILRGIFQYTVCTYFFSLEIANKLHLTAPDCDIEQLRRPRDPGLIVVLIRPWPPLHKTNLYLLQDHHREDEELRQFLRIYVLSLEIANKLHLTAPDSDMERLHRPHDPGLVVILARPRPPLRQSDLHRNCTSPSLNKI